MFKQAHRVGLDSIIIYVCVFQMETNNRKVSVKVTSIKTKTNSTRHNLLSLLQLLQENLFVQRESPPWNALHMHYVKRCMMHLETAELIYCLVLHVCYSVTKLAVVFSGSLCNNKNNNSRNRYYCQVSLVPKYNTASHFFTVMSYYI